MTMHKFVEMWLDWRNSFLTVEVFASHYGITREEAEFIIDTGRKIDGFELELNGAEK